MKTNGPWKIKKRTLKYRNQYLTFYEDAVIRPDGKPGAYAFVDVKNGVSMLPIDDRGNVYLARQFRYVMGNKSLEVSTGGIDRGETPIQAAKRELQEELGITAKKWIPLKASHPFTGLVKCQSYGFIAQKLQFGSPHNSSNERIAIVKMSLGRAVQLVMNGTIYHLPSCVLILKAEKYLKKLNS